MSGTYWIRAGCSKPFQVYCDMDTLGGGWSLVYSYTFTNYESFNSLSNAVTPRPNWPAYRTNVPISTTPPLNESSLGAVDWNYWNDIGHTLMVKSNINDWIVCQPDGGSIVVYKNGSMICQNIKNVATTCSDVVPHKVGWHACGPGPVFISVPGVRFCISLTEVHIRVGHSTILVAFGEIMQGLIKRKEFPVLVDRSSCARCRIFTMSLVLWFPTTGCKILLHV